jgi:hypothetical protein
MTFAIHPVKEKSNNDRLRSPRPQQPAVAAVLSKQTIHGSFAFALNYLVDHDVELHPWDTQFNNDKVGASAFDPRIVLNTQHHRLHTKLAQCSPNAPHINSLPRLRTVWRFA